MWKNPLQTPKNQHFFHKLAFCACFSAHSSARRIQSAPDPIWSHRRKRMTGSFSKAPQSNWIIMALAWCFGFGAHVANWFMWVLGGRQRMLVKVWSDFKLPKAGIRDGTLHGILRVKCFLNIKKAKLSTLK